MTDPTPGSAPDSTWRSLRGFLRAPGFTGETIDAQIHESPVAVPAPGSLAVARPTGPSAGAS